MSMTVAQFVPNVSFQATGKVNSYITGSTKWLKIVALANTLIQDWARESGVEWQSLYSPDFSIGTVTATNSFPIPSTVRTISSQQGDVVRILHTDGLTFTDYDIIDANRQKDYAGFARTFQDSYVQQVGATLRFNRAFTTTDPQFGGTITVPAYTFPATISADSDVIPVDDPNWLVYATAAAYDSTDVTRQQLVPRLEAKANQLMDRMKADNDGQLTTMYQPWRPGSPIPGETGL